MIGIANTLGHFVVVEKDFHLIFDKSMEKVSVELDVSKCLLVDLDIVCNDQVISQRLDYLNMPFRCNYCHETSHLRDTCTFLLHGLPLSKGFVACDHPSRSLPVVSPPTTPPVAPSPTGLYGSSSPTLMMI